MQAKGREKDEELALFFDLRRREKENEENSNLSSENLDDLLLESGNNENSPISKCLSALPLQRKSRDELLNSQNEKSDYDWLLTPPGTPLFSLESESQRTEANRIEIPASRPIALRSRPANIQVDPASKRKVASKTPIQAPDSNPSAIAMIRRPPSAEGPKQAPRRSATPTPRSTLPSATKPSRSSTSNPRPSVIPAKTTGPPSRPSTPARSSARSSTPTARPSLPASKPAARSATPTRQPRAPQTTSTERASSVSKARPAEGSKSSSRPWKPSEMPGFSVNAPPNLKTKLPERPASASRGRPAGPGIVKSTCGGPTGSNGRPRQQSCSPARVRAPQSSGAGSSYRSMTRSTRGDGGDEDSPVVMGTKMVERVVNMRKLAPPKREDGHSSSAHGNLGGKSSPIDSLGFGRTLSKKSLDMALRHMDIRRSMQGNNSLRPLVTSVPASSVYSVRSGPTKNRTQNSSDSPHATSSDAGSEPSVTNAALCLDVSDVESEK